MSDANLAEAAPSALPPKDTAAPTPEAEVRSTQSPVAKLLATHPLAMRVAGGALAKGDVKAITPFIKVIDRLDRYQELANEAAPRRRRTPEDALVIREMIRRIRDDAAPRPR